jgi:hypothetical protein
MLIAIVITLSLMIAAFGLLKALLAIAAAVALLAAIIFVVIWLIT